MMKVSLLATTVGLSVASFASAEFIGFDGTVSVNTQGNNVVQMFAVFDNADAVGLNVFNADIGTDGDFIHNDVQVGAGGTWLPSASLDIPGFADSGNDSYVTIGYGVGAAAALNGTSLDPGFGDTGGLGGTIPSGAGWFNGNPPNEQVASAFAGGTDGISGYAVMIGQFVFAGELLFSFDAEMGSNAGSGSEVDFGSDVFSIPAPGALALLGLGGLATRRRRG
jgi:predicted NBD/HSP70 family sugar kinase